MSGTSTSTFTARVDKDEETLLQTYMPQYELCQVDKKYVTFWKLVLAAHSQAFPLMDKLWPGEGRVQRDLSEEEHERFTAALIAKQNSIKEWFRWRSNPRSRNTSNSVSKKDIQRIYQPGRRRSHKEYEIFAKMYPTVFEPVYEEACRIQGVTGRNRLGVYHKVASRLYREATPEVRSAVKKKVEVEVEEREGELEKIDLGKDTPEAYQHFQTALPGILTAAIDPAVRRAGMIAVCTMIGPVPEAGGQIMATTLQFGDSPDTPLFSQVWVEHDKSFVEALGQFAVKYEFPEDLCAKRSMAATQESQTEPAPAGSSAAASQPSGMPPAPTEVSKKGKGVASSASKSKHPSKVPASRPKEASLTASETPTPVPGQAMPLASSVPIPPPIQSPSVPSNSSNVNPSPIPAPGGSLPTGASSGLGPDSSLAHQSLANQSTPGAPVHTNLSTFAGAVSNLPTPGAPVNANAAAFHGASFNQFTPGAPTDPNLSSFPSTASNQHAPGALLDTNPSPFPDLSELTDEQLSRLLYHDSELRDDVLDPDADTDADADGELDFTWEEVMGGFDPSKIAVNTNRDPDIWANWDVLRRMSSSDTNTNINMNADIPALDNTPNPSPASLSPHPSTLPPSAPNLTDGQTSPLQPSAPGELGRAPGERPRGLEGGSLPRVSVQSVLGPPSISKDPSFQNVPSNPFTSFFGSSTPPLPPLSLASATLNTPGVPAPAPLVLSPGSAVPASSGVRLPPGHSGSGVVHPSPLGVHPPVSANQINPGPCPNSVPNSAWLSNATPAASTSSPALSASAVQQPAPTAAPAAQPPNTNPTHQSAPSTTQAAVVESAKPPPITARSSLGIPTFASQLLSQERPNPPPPAFGASFPQLNLSPSDPPLQANPATQPQPDETPGATTPSNGNALGGKRPRPKPRMRKSKKMVESPPPENAPVSPSNIQTLPPNSATPPLPPTDIPPSPLPAELPPLQPPAQGDITGAENGGTRRSARPITKNTWLEKQNLIGTNIAHAPHLASTADATDEIPPWFLSAVEYFKTGDLGTEWIEVLQLWALLERSLGFGRIGKTPLPVQNRPEEWQKWTAKAKNGARAYDKIPEIEEPAEFGSSISRWWCSLQPQFRISAETGTLLPVYSDDTAEGDIWAPIRKSGPNGFVSVVTLLDWWGRGAKTAGPFKDASQMEWGHMVSDVKMCLNEMLKPVAKRPVEVEPESSNKRQRVKK